MVHLAVSYYHVTYEFQSESTLCSCLIVMDLLARNRRHIRSLATGFEPTTTQLVKEPICVVSTYLYGEFDYMASLAFTN